MSKQKFDISIKELLKVPTKDLQQSKLILQFEGKNVNETVINALRRTSILDVPTYAFDSSTIDITYNDSIFDNDEMRLRISQLCIPAVDNSIIFLPERYWRDVDYKNDQRDRHPDDTKNIEIIMNAHNDTSDNIQVTTNDMKYVEDDEIVYDKFNRKFPSLIIELRPNQSFRFAANAVLGVGERNNIWSAVRDCYYTEDDESKNNRYRFEIKSLGSYDEYDILVRCCKIINKRIVDLKTKLKNDTKLVGLHKENYVNLHLDNEDYTICQCLADLLKDQEDVIFASNSRPDHLLKEMVIQLRVTKSDPMKTLFRTMDIMIDLFAQIESGLTKLGKKYIQI